MLPDVVQDNVTDCAKRMGYKYCEQVFYHAALDYGFGQRAEDKGRELNQVWMTKGYDGLPPFVKDFILRACNGEVPTFYEPKCPECGSQTPCHHTH